MTDDKYAPTLSATATATATQPANTSVESTPELPKNEVWLIDDNLPGPGQRPAWMPAKYQKLADIEKARSELEKKLGSFTGAPDKYDIASLELDEGDPTVQALTEVAKDLNMSQEGFNKFLGRLTSVQETEKAIHLEEQVQKLGKDGERMLVEYKNWTKDYLKPEEVEVVKEWIKDPDDLKVFNRMMAHTHMSAVPTNTTMNMANSFEGVKSLKQELAKNIEKFKTDRNYASDWQSRMERAVARNPNS
jgi:transcriptional regulator with XRE-family HTH domain